MTGDRARLASARERMAIVMARQVELDAASTHTINLDLVGGIGFEWVESGRHIAATEIAARLRRDRCAPVRAVIDSPGGSVQEAKRVREELLNHRGTIFAAVPARCHSAAGLILASAGHRAAAPMATFLLHPAAFCRGSLFQDRLGATELRALAGKLDESTEELIRVYDAAYSAPPGWFAAAVASGQEISAWQARFVGMITAIDGLKYNLNWRQSQRFQTTTVPSGRGRAWLCDQ